MVYPAPLNQQLRLKINAFELVTVILKYLGTDEKTCAARQEFRSNRSQNLLELLSSICLYLHLKKSQPKQNKMLLTEKVYSV